MPPITCITITRIKRFTLNIIPAYYIVTCPVLGSSMKGNDIKMSGVYILHKTIFFLNCANYFFFRLSRHSFVIYNPPMTAKG